jgi:hypothetical protein
MRIAMLTLNVYDNYGNMLQKYALYRTLKKFAETVEVLWVTSTKPFAPYALELNSQAVGNLRDTAFKCVRQNKFKEFNDANMRTRFNIPHLADIADDYDFFVVGSDQVWNPEFFVPGRFLDFAPPEKRIAYAASIAVPELPEKVIENYRQKISEMAHVSVREREGCNLVEKLTGQRPLQVVDPVLLLSAEEWRELEKRPTWFDQKKYTKGYILTYFFNGKPPKQVNALAAKLELPIINLKDIDNFNHYVTGVEEFLYLMDHATLFCTHSYHGTAFATIFNRPFIVYKFGNVLLSRLTRVMSLLNLFNLKDRITDNELNIKVKDPLEIDFSGCAEVLRAEQKKALKFLTNALW